MVKRLVVHSPTLSTVLMVEEVLERHRGVLSVAKLKKILPRKVNHTTLMVILEYLEKSKKISVSLKGILWEGVSL